MVIYILLTLDLKKDQDSRSVMQIFVLEENKKYNGLNQKICGDYNERYDTV